MLITVHICDPFNSNYKFLFGSLERLSTFILNWMFTFMCWPKYIQLALYGNYFPVGIFNTLVYSPKYFLFTQSLMSDSELRRHIKQCYIIFFINSVIEFDNSSIMLLFSKFPLCINISASLLKDRIFFFLRLFLLRKNTFFHNSLLNLFITAFFQY